MTKRFSIGIRTSIDPNSVLIFDKGNDSSILNLMEFIEINFGMKNNVG